MRVGHYAPRIWAQGGIANYIRRLGDLQTSFGHAVYYFGHAETANDRSSNSFIGVDDAGELFEKASELALDIVHLHKPVDWLPPKRIPTVRTMHGHQGSCPSGTRFLSRTEQPCNRAYTIPGCVWGHYVDRCGSRHPLRALSHFTRIHHEMGQATLIHTYTVSQFLRNEMVRSGCSPERLHTILSPAPVVEGPYEPPDSEGVPRFVFLGRIVPQKGLGWLLRALARIEKPVHLDIAGEGQAREAMQELAVRLGVSDRVTFHGWVDDKKGASLISSARAVVFPSLWHEPAGLVSLEAAAYGRPVVASRVGGIPEYARPAYAFLVEPNDLNGLAEAINRLAADWSLAVRMGQEGRRLAETNFNPMNFIQQLDAFYQLAIDETRGTNVQSHDNPSDFDQSLAKQKRIDQIETK